MELFYTALAWFVGGVVTGISGMGGALVTVPVMTLFLDIQFVVIISNITLIYMSIFMIWKYWEYADLKTLIPLCVASLPGIFAGTLILYYVPAAYLQIIMATFLISYVIWNFVRKGIPREKTAKEINMAKIICGFFAGLFGSSISFPGPILAIFCLYTKAGTKQSFTVIGAGAIVVGLFSCIGYWGAGLYEASMISYILVIIPTVTIGIYAVNPIIKYITDEKFKIVILSIVGIASLFASLSALEELGFF